MEQAATRRVERRAPAFLPVPGELEVVALAGHADDDAAEAEQPPTKRADTGNDGHRAGRDVAPGASGQHGEEYVAAAGKIVHGAGY
jgi:hypothetical protein